ncbi:hypothetical protein HanRHA438_Chr01g0013381 [Helianthus annuus]|nr:hypothetical protein HanRHA438_Chr01g0013381 [Helianthus annuus]
MVVWGLKNGSVVIYRWHDGGYWLDSGKERWHDGGYWLDSGEAMVCMLKIEVENEVFNFKNKMVIVGEIYGK